MRGKGLSQQVQLLKNLCRGKHGYSIDSIMPIITKCSTVSDKNDIEVLREVVKEQLGQLLVSEENSALDDEGDDPSDRLSKV